MSGIQTTKATIDVQKNGSIEGWDYTKWKLLMRRFTEEDYTTTTDLPAFIIVLNFYTDLTSSSPENFIYTRQIKEG